MDLTFSPSEIDDLFGTGLDTIQFITDQKSKQNDAHGSAKDSPPQTQNGPDSGPSDPTQVQGAKPKSHGIYPPIPTAPPVPTARHPGSRVDDPVLYDYPRRGKVTTHEPKESSQADGYEYDSYLAQNAKTNILKRWTDVSGDVEPIPMNPEVFKRGADLTKPTNPNPGHRREWSIGWVGSTVKVLEWCNPTCSPITATSRYYECVCGICPKICPRCVGDYGHVETAGRKDWLSRGEDGSDSSSRGDCESDQE
ncbi:V protein [Orthorubulavirus mapueraense]|uniref:V protein n=1 Tax=Orthorubulavirus mapueraense TaxID=3052559 RepID=A3R041_9MONO|nr:V protein [Orthorubulavirus mapueraense]ABL84841.1 V protein [Orthorubulavirus mapueraense]